MPVPELKAVQKEHLSSSSQFDALVVVAPSSSFSNETEFPFASSLAEITLVDKKFGSDVVLVANKQVCGGRLVLSPISSLDQDTDDVRQVADAAKKGILRAKAAGSQRPLLHLAGVSAKEFPDQENALQVALLAALEATYERLQARSALGEDTLETIKEIGFVLPKGFSDADAINTVEFIRGIEVGRRLARDVGGSDPERMTPLNCAEYIQQAMNPYKSVKVTIVENDEELKREYPLLHAVARTSRMVPRHRPCVVHLEYQSDSPVETLMISGKGVTYDTGGADVKTEGHMAGMSRDKCGAANAAGLVLTAAALKVPGVRIVAELGFVRNSIGSDSYVADEIITSHAGVRVMVGNTDAEGRMVLSDCLSHLRKQALSENIKNPRLMTIATLTGHVIRAYGCYTAVVENGAAKQLSLASNLQQQAHLWGDPIEISTLRREDLNMIASKNNAYDILQCNNAASSATARGHQFPAAFIMKAAGVDKHSKNSATPLPFTHLDIAGSSIENMDYQFGKPTAAPLVALTARYLLPRLPYVIRGLSHL